VERTYALARRSPFSKIWKKLKSSWDTSFGDQDRARLNPKIYRASADHPSLIARELQTVREGLNDVRATSVDRLSLIARELQALREGLNDVLRSNYPYYRKNKPYDWEKKPFLIPSRQSPTELPAAASREELNLTKQRILTEIDRRYRGSEQALKVQLEFYLPLIQEISKLGTVVDVGCGRGTFLEIMRDHQIDAIGLEINQCQIEECRRKNLDVRLIDALEFMCLSEANQYGAITFFHVVEHLDFEILVAILMEAYRALVPGGMVLIETPNAEDTYVSYMFNVDPTHIKPITYQYISTVLNVLCFECERLPVRASLHSDDSGETDNRHLNNLLSMSAKLAVVARKPREVAKKPHDC
jgi:O-antigen chain-terminating methyltransferase